jgi:hypothetical protein
VNLLQDRRSQRVHRSGQERTAQGRRRRLSARRVDDARGQRLGGDLWQLLTAGRRGRPRGSSGLVVQLLVSALRGCWAAAGALAVGPSARLAGGPQGGTARIRTCSSSRLSRACREVSTSYP